MLEKIGAPGCETVSRPDKTVLNLLQLCMAETEHPVFFEIGVGVGATTIEVARTLNNRGSIWLFSRENEVRELKTDLEALGYANINGDWASPHNTYSGYHFELAYAFCHNAIPRFDLAYIDGGHVFHLDAPAACVLKELCKPGGYMAFDDWQWSLAKSPTLNPGKSLLTKVDYDERQISECHVQLVCKCIMDTDHRFEFIGLKDDTAIYRRRA
jgi:SAM-dependent methyltransferase